MMVFSVWPMVTRAVSRCRASPSSADLLLVFELETPHMQTHLVYIEAQSTAVRVVGCMETAWFSHGRGSQGDYGSMGKA